MLCAFFFTRRLRWLVLDAALHRHGRGRLRAHRLALEPRRRRHLVARRRRPLLAPRARGSRAAPARSSMGLVVVVLVVAAGWLLFNNSQTTCCASSAWSRCSARRRPNKGSGDIRSNLTEPRPADRRRHAASLGAGPGQAEGIIALGHRRARHHQPAQLVARDLRRRRPRRLRPAPRLLPAAGDRAVADRAARPRPAHALPRQRHRAGAARLDDRRPSGRAAPSASRRCGSCTGSGSPWSRARGWRRGERAERAARREPRGRAEARP